MNFDQHASLDEIASALGRPEILSALVIEGGQNNLVLDTGELIVRVPRHDGASRDLGRETKVLAALVGRLPLPIPNVAVKTLASGTVVAMHMKLPGTALRDLAGVSFAARQQFAEKLAGFLLALHALPVDVLGGADEPDDPLAEWSGLLAEVDAKVLPLLSTDTAMAVRARFERFLAGNGEPHPRVVIHGDFGTGNILVDNGKVSGIIDFAGCTIGDPAYDLASLSAGLGDDFLALMRRSYPGIDAMRERICFYRSTFPLLDVLFGLEYGDVSALNAGLEALRRG
ncbi:phosphotransferase [Shinella kummerowiae]|jgi:aminoglycoside 2''-phosphotransferase|uniref:Phosphotransferase n=1 Tax=Shinella kummerowiae TaxID=417745 RepID=A0A6N8SJD8_9HYPH|nr:phosphotransferase [Shinella kummerowiae]MXN48597.1 phosphotransferase [Shinella kummerowiae]